MTQYAPRIIASTDDYYLEDNVPPPPPPSEIPTHVFNPTPDKRTRLRRFLHRKWACLVHPLRYLYHATVAYSKASWKAWHHKDMSRYRSRWARLNMWWAREGPFVKMALFVGVCVGFLLLHFLFTYVSHTRLYSLLLEKASKALDSNKNPISNLYLPSQLAVPLEYDPWLADHVPLLEISAENVTRGYVSCPVKAYWGKPMNVTLPTLEMLLSKSCPPDGSCTCAAASQVGLGCSAVYVNSFREGKLERSAFLIGPTVEDSSGKLVGTRLTLSTGGGDSVLLKRDSWIRFAYYNSKGKLTRENYELGEASCISAAMDFNRGVFPR